MNQPKDRLIEITQQIETGIQDLFQSGKYADYLKTMIRFHRYSVNNQILIHMQKPDATLVAGFNKWKNQFGRHVIRGEKGITIIAPAPIRKKIQAKILDPDTQKPLLDETGQAITEEKVIQLPMFKPTKVFDISQTDGKPLPTLVSELHGQVENYHVFLDALRRSSPVPILMEPMENSQDGYFSLKTQDIHIREGMSEVQTVSAIIHEITHAKLHNRTQAQPEKYEVVNLSGILNTTGLFTKKHIDETQLPDGLHCYELRGTMDNPSELRFLEEHVITQFAGSLVTTERLDLGEGGCVDISQDITHSGQELSIQEFYESAYPERSFQESQALDRNTQEVEAESVSYAVCAYYGIETGENSFGYIAGWSKDKTLPELKASLETINRTASELITEIDRHYADIQLEQGAGIPLDDLSDLFDAAEDILEHDTSSDRKMSILDRLKEPVLPKEVKYQPTKESNKER